MSFIQLSSSDITTVPTEVNKTWEYTYCELINGNELTVYKGKNSQIPFNSSVDLRSHDLYERLIYHSINQVYYNQIPKSISEEYSLLGDIITLDSNFYNNPTYAGIIRNFPTSSTAVITVLRFKKDLIGSLISPKSFKLTSSTYNIIDDGKGNIIDISLATPLHIGNIFYESGIIVITLPQYQSVFPGNPIAYNDKIEFYYNQPDKVYDPLANDSIFNYIPGSLTIINPDEYISVVNDKIVILSNIPATRKYYYTYKVSSTECGSIISNQGEITVIISTNSAVFDFNVEAIQDFCSFNFVATYKEDNGFNFFVESLATFCKFTGVVEDVTGLCDFILDAIDNDLYCYFDLDIEGTDILPTPTPTRTPTPTPTKSPLVSGSPLPTVTPTRTPTPTTTTTQTTTPTPTPTKSNPNMCTAGPLFYTPNKFEYIRNSGLQFNFTHTGVTSLKWVLKNLQGVTILQGVVSAAFTSGLFDSAFVSFSGILPYGSYKFSISGNNCNSNPDETDIDIIEEQITPTPTPTPSETPNYPTPTPTRSPIPVGACKTYKVRGNNSSGSPSVVSYIDCNGSSTQSGLVNFGTEIFVCSISVPTPISGYWGGATGLVTLWNSSGCNTTPDVSPTPTPTPDTRCKTYKVVGVLTNTQKTVYQYTDCNGTVTQTYWLDLGEELTLCSKTLPVSIAGNWGPAVQGTIYTLNENGCDVVVPTPTPTPTVTSSPTPTETPPPNGISSNAVILNSNNSSEVFSYEPQNNTSKSLFTANISFSADIAHTETKLWVYDNTIVEYNITLNPFTQSQNKVYTIVGAIGRLGAGLCAANDTTLYSCYSSVQRIALSGTTATVTKQFDLPANSYCTGDLIYDTTNQLFAISYYTQDGATYTFKIGIFNSTGTLLRSAVVPSQTIYGIYQYNGITYIIDSAGAQWTINLSTLITTPSTSLNRSVAGASQLPSKISIPLV